MNDERILCSSCGREVSPGNDRCLRCGSRNFRRASSSSSAGRSGFGRALVLVLWIGTPIVIGIWESITGDAQSTYPGLRRAGGKRFAVWAVCSRRGNNWSHHACSEQAGRLRDARRHGSRTVDWVRDVPCGRRSGVVGPRSHLAARQSGGFAPLRRLTSPPMVADNINTRRSGEMADAAVSKTVGS